MVTADDAPWPLNSRQSLWQAVTVTQASAVIPISRDHLEELERIDYGCDPLEHDRD